MKPINLGGHAAYQTKLITLLTQYYPDAFVRFSPSLWDTIGKFFSMDLTQIDVLMYDRYSIFGPPPRLPSDMIRSFMLSLVMKKTSFTDWSEELKTNPLAAIISGFHPDDTPGVGTFYDFCNRWYSQPDTDCGYDSSRHKYYYGYDLYMMTAADSDNDLPVFPLLNRASMHDSFGLCYTYHAMKAFLKEANVTEVLLDSAHDVMAIYRFCQKNSISAVINLNERGGVNFKYKDTYSIGKDGIPMCQTGLKMIRDGYEKGRMRYKFRCPNVCHRNGIHCEHTCSDSPYGLVVHVPTRENPRIFTVPARDSKA